MASIDYENFKAAFIRDVLSPKMLAEIEISYKRSSPREPMLERDYTYSAPRSDAAELEPPATSQNAELQLLLKQAKQAPTLGAMIREKAFQVNMLSYRPALFEQGQINRDYWSKLLNDEIKPSKEKLLRVAILLQLDVDDAREILEKAGYSISSTILRDVVVEYCLEHCYYDFVAIEQLLLDNEVQSLFNDRKVSGD